MRTSTKLISNGMAMALTMGLGVARADNDAYRQAAGVPSGQAVLLARGAVALCLPAEGRIVWLDSVGNVSGYVGVGGRPGYADGSASAAQFNHPSSLAADAQGNVFVADTGNQRIRRIAAGNHAVTTVAGTGDAGFDGDSGPALGASFNSPTGIAVDAQANLYIADTGNNRIRRVDAVSLVITTFAGTGDAGFDDADVVAVSGHLNGPAGLAFDPWYRRILVADTGNNAIRSITTDGTMHTLARSGLPGFSGDGGPATAASLLAPTGVAVGSNGLVYFSDTGNSVVRLITASRQVASVASTVQTSIPAMGTPAPGSPYKILIYAQASNNWLLGSTHVIQWAHNLGPKATFAVELSRDGGLTWQLIKNTANNPWGGNYSLSYMTWVVTGPTASQTLIRVRSLNVTTVFDVTPAPINIYLPLS